MTVWRDIWMASVARLGLSLMLMMGSEESSLTEYSSLSFSLLTSTPITPPPLWTTVTTCPRSASKKTEEVWETGWNSSGAERERRPITL